MAALDDYQLVRVLARGGMGIVHEAVERATGRRVALKRILGGALDADAVARFLLEGRALARLDHPAIVRVHSLGQAPGGPFMVMDLVPGESLQRVLEREGPLAPARAVAIAAELADALAHAHERGVLHRDLKPANVLIDAAGAVKLIDFGLARLATAVGSLAHLTRTGEVVGTPAFMAPEQADGRPVDARTDVYGLGATLYALLTGRAPFQAPTAIALLHAVLSAAPTPPSRVRPGLPPGVEELVLACLEKAPSDRPASMTAVRSLLEQVGQRRSSPRRPAWASALVGLALLGAASAGGVAWLATRPDGAANHASPTAAEEEGPVNEFGTGASSGSGRPSITLTSASTRAPAIDPRAVIAQVHPALSPPAGEAAAEWLEHGRRLLSATRLDDAREVLSSGPLAVPSDTAVVLAAGLGDAGGGDRELHRDLLLLRLKAMLFMPLVGDPRIELSGIDQVLRADPTWAAGLFERASARLTAGDLRGSEKDLAALGDVVGGAAYAARLRAMMAAERGALDEALAALDAAERASPTQPELFLQRADVRYRRALRRFERGARAESRPDLERAVDDLDAALRLDPWLATAWWQRAEIFDALGDFGVAAENMAVVVALQGGVAPDSMSAVDMRAAHLLNALRPEAAAAELEGALVAAVRGEAAAYQRAAGVLASLRPDRAKVDWASFYLRSVERFAAAGDASAFVSAVDQLLALGAYEPAVRAAKEALARGADHRARVNLAHALAGLGRFDEALQEWDRLVRENPDAHRYAGRAAVRASLGDLAGALEDYEAAIQSTPEGPHRAALLEARASERARREDARGALDDLRAAHRLAPSDDLRRKIADLEAQLGPR